MITTSFSRHFLLRYFIIFLFVIILTTSSIGVAYYATIKRLESNLEKNNQNAIVQMKDIVQERLNNINYIVNSLGSYYQTNYLLNLDAPLSEGDPMDMIYARDYIDYIGTLTLANELMSELSVYSLSNDSIFTAKGVKSLSSWYNSSFGERPIEDLEQWKELINRNDPVKIYRERNYYSNGVPIRVMPMIQKLPLGSKKRNIGNICVLINCSYLFQGFIDSNTFGNYYIANDKSELLYTFNKNDRYVFPIDHQDNQDAGSYIKEIDNEKLIITYARSDEGLLFVTVTAYSVVMSQTIYLKILFYVMIALSFIALLTAVVMILIRINKPIRSLLNDNYELNHRITEQAKQMQVSTLCRLLTGLYSSKQEILLSLDLVGLQCSDKLYNVVHIILKSDSPAEFYDYTTIKSLTNEFTVGKNLYVIDTGSDCISLIIEFQKSDISLCITEIKSEIKKLQNYLSGYKVTLIAGCGCFYEDITLLRNSYAEAVFSLRNHTHHNTDSICWYNDQNTIPVFFYPIEIEQRILVNTRCGDYRAIEEALNLIYSENYIKTDISDNMSDLLVMKLKTTLLSANNEIQTLDETLYQDILTYIFSPAEIISTKSIFAYIKQKFKAICRITSMSQTIRNNQLKLNLLEFIDNHFFEHDICLTRVADSFHISEAYLSTFFKEQTGINFITYIETKRLTMACALLKERELTIDAIAVAIGYTSAHSFRRAFKRNYGISPANYCP